jgi:hypothetical protein
MKTNEVVMVVPVVLSGALAVCIAVPALLAERAALAVGVRVPERWMDRVGSVVSWLIDGWRWG